MSKKIKKTNVDGSILPFPQTRVYGLCVTYIDLLR